MLQIKNGLHVHDCFEQCQDIKKVCSKCNESKPLIDFRIEAECKDGHLSYCKQCRYNDTAEQNRSATKILYDKNVEINKNHNCEIDGCKNVSKVCPFCKVEHTLNFFRIDKGRKTVHRSVCRVWDYKRSAKDRKFTSRKFLCRTCEY